MKKVYRRRRIVGLIVLALVVWGLWAGIAALVGWVGSIFGAPTGSSDPSSSVSAQANGEVGQCSTADIEVQAFVGDGTSPKSVFAKGEDTQLWFSVTNNGPQDCLMNFGAKEQIFTITSGAETIWTSAHCDRSGLTDQVMTIASGEQKISTPSPWLKVRSSSGGGCGEGQTPVVTGGASYHLIITVGGFESNDLQFILN